LTIFDAFTEEEAKQLSAAFYYPDPTQSNKPTWEALSPKASLRYWRLIEINQPGAQPLTTSPLRADERIVNYIKGLNYPDDRLEPLLARFDISATEAELLPPSQQAVAQTIARHLAQFDNNGRTPILQLVGTDPLSKQLVAQQVLSGRRLLARLPVELLPTQVNDIDTIARLWQRESMLLPIALYLDAHTGLDSALAPDGRMPALQILLSRDLGLVLLDTREVQPGLGAYNLPIDIAKPTPAEQQQAWSEALGLHASDIAAQLASQFNLNLPTIRQIARSITDGLPEGEQPSPDRAWQACLLHTRPKLDKLAQRLEPRASWDDIVLPKEALNLLKQISAQVGQRSKVYDEWGFRHKMNRGLGISALFAGESGVGKTMAAEVIARDLKLNLYRIDLSAVVSKYIGETEKNLCQVFDAAEGSGAVLFFDEADALFGKRSEVKDSHDRYANIETSFLLQRMEEYRGLAILATNMKSALDTAFLRRLRFIVNLPFPDQAGRKLIWQKVFPPDAPTEALDYDFLARFNLTGGSIHNIALNAAFLAAQGGAPVSMPLLISAARTELRKLEKTVSEVDFRLPEAVKARQETWLARLVQQVEENGLALSQVDYERLSWFELSDAAIAAIIERSIQRARSANKPVTIDLLLDAIEAHTLAETEYSPAHASEPNLEQVE